MKGKLLTDFRRHLEGWQAGAVAITMVLLAALLVVPRGTQAADLPLPRVDRREQERDSEREAGRAEAARRTGLPYLVRAVGEGMRGVGAHASGTASDRTPRAELKRLIAAAREAHGDAPLLSLRALQGELFAVALSDFLRTGAVSTDLRELGGNFPEVARKKGWVKDGRLRAPERDFASLYLVRWTALAGLLNDRAFSPSLNEWRAYYRMHLAYPDLPVATPDDVALHLEEVAALSAKDPEYPALLARAVLSMRLGRYPEAALSLRAHLGEHKAGPWTLRARNYLAECLGNAPAPEESP